MPLIRKQGEDSPAPQPAPVEVLYALANGNQEERWAAARAAAHMEGCVDALSSALAREADANVREAILTSLITIGSPRSIEAIIPLVRVDDAGLRTAALDALRTKPQLVREYLPALLNDEDSDVRVLSCEIVRGLPTELATPMLCALLKSEEEANVCAAAIDVLAEVGSSEAMPVLEECALRFAEFPFLVFAIQIARERVLSHTTAFHV